jgi:3-hydroxybutyryl-CoA dehydrogenase
MRIAVYASDSQKNEILSKGINENVHIIWLRDFQENINVDACFDLLFDETEASEKRIIHNIPVFVNTLLITSSKLPPNYIRVSAWNGFLKRELLEVATSNEHIKEKAALILSKIGWKFTWVPDVPGMIAARVISMIINEAYFALGDKISTKEEIDIAMKLGTNYPYGPFEWSEKIGLQKIYMLLKKLNETEGRYDIAPLLIEEAKL